MKKYIIIIASVLGIILLAAGFQYFSTLREYRQTIENINISSVDLNTIEDGQYTGACEAVWVAAEVIVTVQDHKITDIKLHHSHGRGEDAEVIPDRIIEAQSLEVDMVSGATSSSKVILKAVENALSGSPVHR